nr:immunoglobulin light chain junction region [Macaca mulatta]
CMQAPEFPPFTF